MLKLELKRIFSKKLNVLAVGLMVILAAVFSGFAATSNRYVDAHGAVSTGMLATRKLAENKQGYAGTLREAELAKIVAQYKAVMAQSQDEQDANYGTLYQPIDDILNFMISVLTPDAGYDETVLDSVTEDSVQDFYTWYQSNMKWMADQYGKTPAQVMLRWHIQRGVVVIPKSTHVERMEENFNVFDFSLSDEDMKQIADLDEAGSGNWQEGQIFSSGA